MSESESESERQSAHASLRTRESVRARDTLSVSLARASQCCFSLSPSISLSSVCEKKTKREFVFVGRESTREENERKEGGKDT